MDLRDVIRQLSMLLSEWGAGDPEALHDQLVNLLADVDDRGAERLFERLETTGAEFGYHPPDPLARRLSRFVLDSVLEPGSGLVASEAGLAAARRGPVIFLGNHLSFVDANVFEALVARADADDIAQNLTVLVGPKVYSRTVRRLASLCFGAIKIPQPTSRASGEAVMSRREVARLATRTLATFAERQVAGDHLLIFVEGTRSRSGDMARVLAAAARYLERPGSVVVPFGLWGSERLVPLDDDHFHPTVVQARLGPGIDCDRLREAAGGRRPVVSDAIGYMIADLLPVKYRGFYADAQESAAGARELASEFGAG